MYYTVYILKTNMINVFHHDIMRLESSILRWELAKQSSPNVYKVLRTSSIAEGTGKAIRPQCTNSIRSGEHRLINPGP